MGSLAEIRQNRLRIVRDIRKSEKLLDTELEKLERFLFRMLERKLKLPQLEDLDKILDFVKSLDILLTGLERSAVNAITGFRF